MALYATNRFPGDGTTTSYEFNFVGKYIDRTHVKVYQEDNATKVRTYVSINDSNFLNDTTLRSLPVTPVGSTLVIYRDTPKPPIVDFVNGSRFTEYNLDLVARQGLFVAMEALDAGDSDARQRLLDAITVVGGLVDGATAAVSDATAAALAAATSASNAAAAATAAGTAKTAAEAAKTAAETAKTAAETASTNAQTSVTAAATSATNAATSASTANTRATAANTSATNAATSATNASNSASTATTQAANAATSATNAAASATQAAGYATTLSIQGRMSCRVVVTDPATRTLTLQRCGGQTMSINGTARVIPAAGISISVTSSATPAYLYAYWTGTAIALTELASAPAFDNTLGQWTLPGNLNYTPVAYFHGAGLATPERFLRNYYNGPGACAFASSLTTDYTANWDGVERSLINLQFLVLPGDSVSISANASVMSAPIDRVGDLVAKLNNAPAGRARNTHSGTTYTWLNYSCSAGAFTRGVTEAAAQATLSLHYQPINTNGNTYAVLGDGASTRLTVTVTPYKFA